MLARNDKTRDRLSIVGNGLWNAPYFPRLFSRKDYPCPCVACSIHLEYRATIMQAAPAKRRKEEGLKPKLLAPNNASQTPLSMIPTITKATCRMVALSIPLFTSKSVLSSYVPRLHRENDVP